MTPYKGYENWDIVSMTAALTTFHNPDTLETRSVPTGRLKVNKCARPDRRKLEDVVLATLEGHPGLRFTGDNEDVWKPVMETYRGGWIGRTNKLLHQSVSASLSVLQTEGIAESIEGYWYLVLDWKSKWEARNAKAEDERMAMEKVKAALRPTLLSLTKAPEIQAVLKDIDSQVNAAAQEDVKADDLRESIFRNRVFAKWSTRAWFTNEVLAVEAAHHIDVSLYATAGCSRADNSEWNGHPASPNLNRWERLNLVRLLPTEAGVRLEVLCGDPEILKYNGREELIPDAFDRGQVHRRLEVRNDPAVAALIGK